MSHLVPPKKEKKTDYAALNSPFARIPGMSVPAARDLLDLGFYQVIELSGRSPEFLFEEIRRKRPETPDDRILFFRLAVYYAETPEPDPSRLKPWAWTE